MFTRFNFFKFCKICITKIYHFNQFWMFSGSRASQVALVVKNPPANAGDIRYMGSIPGLGRSPGERIGNPLQYSCLENPHGQRSLVGYSPQGRKELDMTEQLSTAQHMHGWLIHSIAILRSLVPVLHSPWHLHFTCLIPSWILCPRWDFQPISKLMILETNIWLCCLEQL